MVLDFASAAILFVRQNPKLLLVVPHPQLTAVIVWSIGHLLMIDRWFAGSSTCANC